MQLSINKHFYISDPQQVNELQSGRRIYGGQEAKIERFPFMASVQFFKKFQCAGSIITADVVITSASCLQLAWNNRFYNENPAFLSLQVGSTYYEHGGENIPVLEIHFHPNYEPKTLGNNLALLRMVRALSFGRKQKKIKRIDIDRNPWPLPSNTEGITIVGWGARSLNTHIIEQARKNRLTYAVLDFYPHEECQEIYSSEFVTRHNFCAGFFSKGGGACNRDAGGPGVVDGVLVGVVSFGSPSCGAPDAPTVFTKLGYYTDWIEQIMEQEVPSGKALTTRKPAKRTTFNIAATYIHTSANLNIQPITEDFDTTAESTTENVKKAIRTGKQDFTDFLETLFDSEEVTESSGNDEETDSEEEIGSEIHVKKKNKKKKMIRKKKLKRKHKQKIGKGPNIKDLDQNKLSTTKTRIVKRPLNLRPATERTTPAVNNNQKTRVTRKLVKEYDIFASEEMITPPYAKAESKQLSDVSYGYSDEDKENIDDYSDEYNDEDELGSSEDQQKVDEVIEGLVDNINLNEILGSDENLFDDDSEHEIAKLINKNDKHKKVKLVDTNPYLAGLTKKRLQNKDLDETDDFGKSHEDDREGDSENDSNTEQRISLERKHSNSNKKKKIPDDDDGDDDNKKVKKNNKHVKGKGKKNNKHVKRKGKKKKQKITTREKEVHRTTQRKMTMMIDDTTEKYEKDEGKKAVAEYLENLRARVVKNKEDKVKRIDIHKKRRQKNQDKNKDDETIDAKEKKKQTSNGDNEDEHAFGDELKKQIYFKAIEDILKKKKNVIAEDAVVQESTKHKKKQLISANPKTDVEKLMMDKIYEVMKMKTAATYDSDNLADEEDIKKLVQQSKDDADNSNDPVDVITRNIKKDGKKVKLNTENNRDDESDEKLRMLAKLMKSMKLKKNANKGNRNSTENLFKLIVGSGDIYKLLLENAG
ncbi:MATH and LRR domain-containing protein PFE0570w-like [Spodoptera frugiperda]|uniref:MATH and LRR domain-containing protein PFE0570w-like n=1 Tax=Spodoptera frugiperda TaxID=7108 RepID=A0A9R0EWR3_SPOFR|nr:MATH and LRR domain-containing protein PFE0570w-like [Spodoptera frugiperda]